jgi:DNA-binding transcriptional ArsR family regulator
VNGVKSSLDYDLKKVSIVWHRSRAIYIFDSTYPYNTVKAFFWKAHRGDFEEWVGGERLRIVNINSLDEIYFKNGVIVYKKQTATEPTVIEVTELEGKSIFQVIITGNVSGAKRELEGFVKLLHREIDIDRAKERYIYSEQFIRYHESKEQEVRQAIMILYRLFGDALTEMRHKNEQEIFYLSRAMIFFRGNRLHVKTYRPKNYRSPAQTVFDHPKLEVTVYYEKSQSPKEELEQLARNIIATIVHFTSLYDYIMPPSWGFQYETSGYGIPDVDLLKALTSENLKYVIEKLEKTNPELQHETTRKIAYCIAEGTKTAKEISQKLKLPLRTVQYHVKKLKKAGIIQNNRRGNVPFYSIKI